MTKYLCACPRGTCQCYCAACGNVKLFSFAYRSWVIENEGQRLCHCQRADTEEGPEDAVTAAERDTRTLPQLCDPHKAVVFPVFLEKPIKVVRIMGANPAILEFEDATGNTLQVAGLDEWAIAKLRAAIGEWKK